MSVLSLKHSIFLSLLCVHSLSAESFPPGCKVVGFRYENNYLHLNEDGKQTLYLIQNRADSTIEIERSDSGNVFMSPPLHISMSPLNWSAFSSDEKVHFKCYKRIMDDIIPIDCGAVLDVCQYPRVRFAVSNMGNYWIASDKTQQAVIQEATRKGIYLKW